MKLPIRSVLVGVAVACSAMSALAVDLVITSPVATGVNPTATFDVTVAGFTAANGTIGTLEVDGPGLVTYTYLGKEAGYTNNLFNALGSNPTILDSDGVGTTSVQTYVTAGMLSFSFNTSSPGSWSVANGSATNSPPTFVIFAGGTSGYKWILGYDDKGAGPDRDFDDMVVGVNVTPVPEPEAYALAFAGLGVVGWSMSRRRRRA